MAIKPFQELTLADDFMFGEVMRRPENAKPFLEALLGKRIGSITAIDKQKELTDGAALHGVRLDVWKCRPVPAMTWKSASAITRAVSTAGR